jgi:hypothetical protein
MHWYSLLKFNQRQLRLFDEPEKPKYSESKSDKPRLQVKVLFSNSYGELELLINGNRYKYSLPWSAVDIANEITDYMNKGWGKRVAAMIKVLDRYREQ